MTTTATERLIRDTVQTALVGATPQYLREIVAHGIHTLTNRYDTGDETYYGAVAAEFTRQAEAANRCADNWRE